MKSHRTERKRKILQDITDQENQIQLEQEKYNSWLQSCAQNMYQDKIPVDKIAIYLGLGTDEILTLLENRKQEEIS